MNKVSDKLTVYFEEPFWVGVFEKVEGKKLSVSKVTFGTEPKDYEVYEFLLKHYYDLQFSPSVTTIIKEVKQNPKRRQREVKKQLRNTGIGTKSQQALKLQQEQVTIGVVTKSKSSEYWLSVCDGMEDAAEKYHADVVILSPDSETEEEVQKNMIRDLLKTDIQAMAVSPIDSYECEDYLNFAREKGISVYACDTPIEDSEIPYIGIDNEKLGYELGEQLAKALDHKGKIGVIAGDFKQAGHRMRVAGFEKYMEKEPGITIEMVRNGYSNMRVSQKDVDEILVKYPDLNGIMTTSAVTALGLSEATEGREISIVSVDAQEDALKAVQDGRIVALGAQSGYQIGYETIRYIVKDLEGEGTGEDEILDSQVLTEENIDTYMKDDGHSHP